MVLRVEEAEVRRTVNTSRASARGLVGEVFLGLLESDPSCYLHTKTWQPTLPRRAEGTFGIVGLPTCAQVDPDSRGQ